MKLFSVVIFGMLMLVGSFGPRQSLIEDKGPISLKREGIENLYQISPDLYSGGEPTGSDGFRELAALGIKTVVSVDGAAPDLTTAKQYGMTYVHLPVGYDGIPDQQARALAKVVRTMPGPVLIHCHHGKHRGPTAAAFCAIVAEDWTREEALEWLKIAGTSPDYNGLFKSVMAFEPPIMTPLEEASIELPARAEVADLVDSMVSVSKRWENLKIIAKAGYEPPATHPDLDPPHEALMLAEHYRELQRLQESKEKGLDFIKRLRNAEQNALTFRGELGAGSKLGSDSATSRKDIAFEAVKKDCRSCHIRFRN